MGAISAVNLATASARSSSTALIPAEAPLRRISKVAKA